MSLRGLLQNSLYPRKRGLLNLTEKFEGIVILTGVHPFDIGSRRL
jgi:hypothetical protein